MGKNDSMPMGHDGGMRGTMKPDIDVEGIEGPAGEPGTPGEGPHGEYMMNDSYSDRDMMEGMMGMMSIDQFANHIIALHLTCHPVNDFFEHNLVKILQYIMQKEEMRDGKHSNMTHKPTDMPEGPRPEGPDGSGPGGPEGPGPDTHDGPETDGPNGSRCDMIPGWVCRTILLKHK